MSSASPPSQSASASADTSNTSALERASQGAVRRRDRRARARARPHLTARTRHVAACAADVSLAESSLGCVPLSREALRSLARSLSCVPAWRTRAVPRRRQNENEKKAGRVQRRRAGARPPAPKRSHTPSASCDAASPASGTKLRPLGVLPRTLHPTPPLPRPPAAGGSARRAPCGATGAPPSLCARSPRKGCQPAGAAALRYRPACARARADADAPRRASPSPFVRWVPAQPAPRDHPSPARAAAPPRAPMGA